MVFGRRQAAPPAPALVIGPSDRVQGTMIAESVTVAGAFDGTLEVTQALSVAATGRVTGEVSAERLAIAAGASVRAACRIGPPRQAPSTTAPAATADDRPSLGGGEAGGPAW